MSVAVNTFKYRLPYRDIFGGVSALTIDQFKKVNGFSNEFWGWGGEDDDMSNRIRFHGFKIARYRAEIARYHMVTHKKDAASPDRYVFNIFVIAKLIFLSMYLTDTRNCTQERRGSRLTASATSSTK